MTKNQRKLLELGLTGCMFGFFTLIMPKSILIWLLAIPGILVWWLAFLMFSWWITSDIDRWLDGE